MNRSSHFAPHRIPWYNTDDSFPGTVAYNAGYIDEGMAIAWTKEQITREELLDEADRNKQIKQVVERRVGPSGETLCSYCSLAGKNAYGGCIGIPGCPNV
jgi:hypothetical protein